MKRPGSDSRRCYYDHERAWVRIAERGGAGWDDLSPPAHDDTRYTDFTTFTDSDIFRALQKSVSGRSCKALDLGCGGGQIALQLAGVGWEVIGVEYSATAVRLAERNARERGIAADFRQGDCLQLDECIGRDEFFDLVVDNRLMHCIVGQEDRECVAKSAAGRCEPGGILFSTSMTSDLTFDCERYGVDRSTMIDRSVHGSLRQALNLRVYGQESDSTC